MKKIRSLSNRFEFYSNQNLVGPSISKIFEFIQLLDFDTIDNLKLLS